MVINLVKLTGKYYYVTGALTSNYKNHIILYNYNAKTKMQEIMSKMQNLFPAG